MTCYRDNDKPQLHLLRREHQRGCEDRVCHGCAPCMVDEDGNPTRHCPMCRGQRAEHLDAGQQVCARCVGRLRQDLEGILTAAALMPDEAVFAGIESEAFALSGPVANFVSYGQRAVLAARSGLDPALIDERDENDPYVVLAGYEREFREDLGHNDMVLVSNTLNRTISYLTWSLTDLARREDTLLQLVELRTDAARVRAHLEAVLHDSRTPERGAPCPHCTEELEGTDKSVPRLVLRRSDEDPSGASDTWRCSRCERRWTEAEYRLRVAGNYLAYATALTADQIHQQWRIKPATLRKWAQRGLVAKRGRDTAGRMLYDVAEAKAIRDAG